MRFLSKTGHFCENRFSGICIHSASDFPFPWIRAVREKVNELASAWVSDPVRPVKRNQNASQNHLLFSEAISRPWIWASFIVIQTSSRSRKAKNHQQLLQHHHRKQKQQKRFRRRKWQKRWFHERRCGQLSFSSNQEQEKATVRCILWLVSREEDRASIQYSRE